MSDRKDKNGLTRKDILKCTALMGGAYLASQLEWAQGLMKRAEAGQLTPEEEYDLKKAENILYTVCLQCNTGCGIKVKFYRKNGSAVALKIDGSAYSPYSMVPHLPYKSEPEDMAPLDFPICPKGQAGLQTMYDPYRIVKVLKRAGRRGENKWKTIPFDKAVDEIVNGGMLFNDVPGEAGRNVTGLKDIYVLKDPKIMKELDTDIKALRKEKDKKAAVENFKKKHADKLKYLIDPDHPDFGPKNNQMIYMWGRKKGGRSNFSLRFFQDYFGTTNNHGHTTVCQGSLYFASKATSDQYEYNKFSGGQKFYWQGDLENSEYVLFVGSNLFDANYGPTNRTARLMPNIISGKTKIAVADPRLSKLASKAHKYLPVKPGTDGAMFSGIIKWMIDNKKYDEKFLSCANKGASADAGEPTFCNAAWLVKLDEKGKPGKFLRAHEIGLAQAEKRKDKDGKEHDFEYLVAYKNGSPVAFDPNDEKKEVTGDLFVNTEIRGIKVKSSLQIIKEDIDKKSVKEWAAAAGLQENDIVEVARELTGHGKKACVDVHRGIAQHTNGFYNVNLAWAINMLIGNFDWKGGMIAASTYNTTGGKGDQPFNFSKMAPGKVGATGISIIRHDIKYEESTIFNGYPAKRNWWPLASDVYEEIIPSAGDAYPYPIKAIFSYMGAPNYSLPAGQTNTSILVDLNKVPLYFTSDILIGPTTMYADYIFPDLTYLERWEFQGSHPNMPAKVQPVRQPVAAPMTEIVKVYGEEVPCSYESLMMAIAERLGIKGYGKDGFGKGMDFTKPDDFYIRMVANIATDGKSVPDADGDEIKLFMNSRKHLPKTVFDPERWEKICGPVWKKVVYVLNRGGRFQDYKDQYKGDQAANKYGKLLNMYQEKTAGTKNAFTGKSNPGYPTYLPITTMMGKTPQQEGLTGGYDLHLITQRDVTQTKSRTIVDYWLGEVYPENHIIINVIDAAKLGIMSGDRVGISSATNTGGAWDIKNFKTIPIVGKALVTETIQPGVVTFTIGHGHWASGASDVVIDNKVVKGDPKRARGFNANAVMWIDPHVKNTCMLDPVGGSVSFYDTKVAIRKV